MPRPGAAPAAGAQTSASPRGKRECRGPEPARLSLVRSGRWLDRGLDARLTRRSSRHRTLAPDALPDWPTAHSERAVGPRASGGSCYWVRANDDSVGDRDDLIHGQVGPRCVGADRLWAAGLVDTDGS